MESAAAALQEALSKVAIKAPRFPVYSNVTGEPFPEDGEAIKALLQRQLVSPVKWEQTLKAVIASGKTKLHELGPGQQVKAMVRERRERGASAPQLRCDRALRDICDDEQSDVRVCCVRGWCSSPFRPVLRQRMTQVKRVDNKVWQSMQCTGC